MRELLYVDRLAAANALLTRTRLKLLRELVEPASCAELAERLGEPPQKLHYHLRQLEDHRLVERVGSRRRRGATAAVYRAAARAYWVPPIVLAPRGRTASRETSISRLTRLASCMQASVGKLAQRAPEARVQALSLAVEVERDEDADLLMQRLDEAVRNVAERHGRVVTGHAGRPAGADDASPRVRVRLGCHPE